MKTILLILLPLLFLMGCSTEGDIKFINRTRHNLYFSLKGDNYTLEGATEELISEGKGTTKKVSIDTGSQFLFWGGDGETVALDIEGETFLLPNNETSTQVKVEPNETTKIFTDPTHASVKVINGSGKYISNIYYFTDFDGTLVNIGGDLFDGDVFFKQLPFATQQEVFYYTFMIQFQDSTGVEEEFFGGPGDENAFLELDEQYLIELPYIP